MLWVYIFVTSAILRWVSHNLCIGSTFVLFFLCLQLEVHDPVPGFDLLFMFDDIVFLSVGGPRESVLSHDVQDDFDHASVLRLQAEAVDDVVPAVLVQMLRPDQFVQLQNADGPAQEEGVHL